MCRLLKTPEIQKIFESEKGETVSLIVIAQKNQGGFSQPYLGERKMTKKTNSAQLKNAKKKLLAQPLPKEYFEFYKTKILAEGPIISRNRLCEVFPFFVSKTLTNWDYEGRGIPGKMNLGSQEIAYYPTQNVVEFIEELYCERPKKLAEKEKQRKREEEEKRKQQEKRTANYYKTGELK